MALKAMAQPDARDGTWLPVPLDGPALNRPIGVAIAPSPFGDESPEVVEAVRAAGRWLARAGFAVEEIAPPGLAEAADLWHRLVINEERRAFAPLVRKFWRREKPIQRRMSHRLRAQAGWRRSAGLL